VELRRCCCQLVMFLLPVSPRHNTTLQRQAELENCPRLRMEVPPTVFQTDKLTDHRTKDQKRDATKELEMTEAETKREESEVELG